MPAHDPDEVQSVRPGALVPAVVDRDRKAIIVTIPARLLNAICAPDDGVVGQSEICPTPARDTIHHSSGRLPLLVLAAAGIFVALGIGAIGGHLWMRVDLERQAASAQAGMNRAQDRLTFIDAAIQLHAEEKPWLLHPSNPFPSPWPLQDAGDHVVIEQAIGSEDECFSQTVAGRTLLPLGIRFSLHQADGMDVPFVMADAFSIYSACSKAARSQTWIPRRPLRAKEPGTEPPAPKR